MSQFEIIRGFPFIKVSWLKSKHIEEGLDYLPHDGDIIITSYPKSGTNWLNYIVQQILSKGEFFPSMDDTIYKYGPFIEVIGTSTLDEMENPRVYKFHFPYDMITRNDKAKYLYMYRKPEDVVVSYYPFMSSLVEEPHTFDEFFEDFLTGNIAYGNPFDHILKVYAHKDDDNVLLISYEKLHRNRKEEILRIAKFLGEEYFQNLSEDDSLLEKIIEHTSFDYMKKNLIFINPGSKEEKDLKEVKYFRKGVIGDGKKILSSDQLKRLHEQMVKKMAGTFILEEWTEE